MCRGCKLHFMLRPAWLLMHGATSCRASRKTSREPAARVVLRKAHYYTLGSLTQRAPKSLDHDEGTSNHFCRRFELNTKP